ncbi:unnamed protein product [Closterium sp. NIES-54]
MEVARTYMIHVAAPHFSWPFAVRYAAHQLNLWPRPAAVDSGIETAGAELGGAETEGEGSGGAGSGGATTGGAGSWGADSGGPASSSGGGAVGDPTGGPGAGQPPQHNLLETLSPQAIRAWIVWRGSLDGGGYGPAGAIAASPGGTAGAGGTVVTAGAGGAAGAGGTRGSAGAGGAGATSPRGAIGAGGAGPTSRGGTAGAGGAGGAAGARGAGAGGIGGARADGLGGARTGGATGTAGSVGTGGTAGAGGAGAAGAGGTAGAGGAGGATGASGTGGPGGSAGAGGAGAGGTGGGSAGGAGGAVGGAGGAAGAAGAGGAGAASAGGAGAAGTTLHRPFFYPQPQSSLPPPDSALRQVLSLPSSTGLPLPLLCPPTDQSQPQLLRGSPLPAPAPHNEVTQSLTERREPETRAFTPFCARRVTHPRPPTVPGTHGMALHPSSVPQRVVLPEPPAFSLPHVPDPESDLAHASSPTATRFLATIVNDPDLKSTAAFALVSELVDFAVRIRLDYVASLVTESECVCPPTVRGELALVSDVLEDGQFEPECLAAVLPHFASMLLCPEGDPDALDIPTPRSYAEAIASEYSSQWQTAIDAVMASWKSTGTYVDEVPPPGANIVDDMWIFIVKRPPGSPPAFKARYVARGFRQRQGVDFFQTFSPTPKMTTLWVLLHVAAQRDYELHSLNFSTAFLQGSLHEEIWLHRPPGFTGTTLAALGFAPSSAEPSLFLRTDTTLPPFYVLVYVDDLVFATANIEVLSLVKAELQERHTCTDLGELRSYLDLQVTRDRARRTITLTRSFIVHQVLQHFGFHFSLPQPTPLSTGHSLSAPPLDDSVEPSVVLIGHSDASWVDDQTTQRSSQGYTFSVGPGSLSWRSTRSSSMLSSSCEAEIYAEAMAAQELRWLTYLLTDLGERPRSPPVLYVDNKAMLDLCHEQRLEHRTKHIALRYFLVHELQQRHQLCLSYVASRANIADVFTKAIGSGDHQCFCTALGLVATLPQLLVA